MNNFLNDCHWNWKSSTKSNTQQNFIKKTHLFVLAIHLTQKDFRVAKDLFRIPVAVLKFDVTIMNKRQLPLKRWTNC